MCPVSVIYFVPQLMSIESRLTNAEGDRGILVM